ncbi:CBS domain-containing protein [Arundinibacter roseus]|uniref:CBS domain-containing protein n=1 Tax=Arundinibacter roseus TaxID=2070510 RepID=A0A4R4K0J0_9BACT|nr:CBS domain-containing protein [Arundinibacter roseus]TDB59831.1 CBS domain-containing protein [Arundinibacter roseus]
MLAATLINPMIPTLKLTDSVSTALDWMHEYHTQQLVVADEDLYKGIVSENILMDSMDDSALLTTIIRQHEDVFATEDQHVYELLRLINQYGLYVVPVISEDGLLMGTVLVQELLERFADVLGIQEKGAVLVLKISERDYSLSEVSRLIESNGTKVISSYYSSSATYDNPDEARLTLKLNRTNINPIVATLERFGYSIEEAHANDPIESIDQERLDMLLRYLAT